MESNQGLCIFLLLSQCCFSVFQNQLMLFLLLLHTYSIEKVQLPDMGSYRCAVLSGSQQTLSDEGRIQLEGEFLFISLTNTEKQHRNQQVSSECFSLIWIVKKSRDSDSANSLAGLPHFSVEPHHMSVVANVSLNLSCVAHGPPEPVRVIWLQDGAPLNSLSDSVALSPSTLNLTGIIFHCFIASAVRNTCTQLSQPH